MNLWRTKHRSCIKKGCTGASRVSVQSVQFSCSVVSDSLRPHELQHARPTKGTFHAKMGTIKDRNSMDLTEAEDIKKRW